MFGLLVITQINLLGLSMFFRFVKFMLQLPTYEGENEELDKIEILCNHTHNIKDDDAYVLAYMENTLVRFVALVLLLT